MKEAKNKNEDKNILIKYSSLGKNYVISKGDFEKVEKYCENECMGIKFLMNANFLRDLVRVLVDLGHEPPFTNNNFISKGYKKSLGERGLLNSMKRKFGTDDIELVSKIVIKSTYNFIYKN